VLPLAPLLRLLLLLVPQPLLPSVRLAWYLLLPLLAPGCSIWQVLLLLVLVLTLLLPTSLLLLLPLMLPPVLLPPLLLLLLVVVAFLHPSQVQARPRLCHLLPLLQLVLVLLLLLVAAAAYQHPAKHQQTAVNMMSG
jgi:hypothetical protein